jgi:hypothetical protein
MDATFGALPITQCQNTFSKAKRTYLNGSISETIGRYPEVID